MKELILAILIVLLSISGYANFSTKTEILTPTDMSAVGDWVCPKCGTVNNGGWGCFHCWNPRPR